MFKKTLHTLFLFVIIAVLSGCFAQNSPPAEQVTSPPQHQPEEIQLQPATPSAQPPAAKKIQEISVETGNLYFKPATITVKVNQPVHVNITNKGGHTFTISEFSVDVSLNGPSASATFTPTKTGTFPITCEIPGHKEAGMKGALIVTE